MPERFTRAQRKSIIEKIKEAKRTAPPWELYRKREIENTTNQSKFVSGELEHDQYVAFLDQNYYLDEGTAIVKTPAELHFMLFWLKEPRAKRLRIVRHEVAHAKVALEFGRESTFCVQFARQPDGSIRRENAATLTEVPDGMEKDFDVQKYREGSIAITRAPFDRRVDFMSEGDLERLPLVPPVNMVDRLKSSLYQWAATVSPYLPQV